MDDEFEPFNPHAPQWRRKRQAHIYPWGDEDQVNKPDELDDLRPLGAAQRGYDDEANYEILPPKQAMTRSLVGNGNLDRTVSGYPPNSVGEARVHLKRKLPPGTVTDYQRVDGDNLYSPFASLNPGTSGFDGAMDAVGYAGTEMTFGPVDRGTCKDYFGHLDRCRKCQRRLKKRVVRYFRAMQRAQNTRMLPGARGMENFSPETIERELFTDRPEDDEPPVAPKLLPHSKMEPTYHKKQTEEKEDDKKDPGIVENFSNASNMMPSAFLLIFGLLIIFVMDSSRNSLAKGLSKIIKL
jgi:hypothetical protein